MAISAHKGYPHGMVQPAVLVGDKEKVWYRWAIVPATVSAGSARFVGLDLLMMMMGCR